MQTKAIENISTRRGGISRARVVVQARVQRLAAALCDKFRRIAPMRAISVIAAFALAMTLSACATHDLGEIESEPDTPAVAAPDVITSEIAMLALGQLGVPYRYGGDNPNEGFDCSGLVGYVYRQSVNVQLPRTTYGLAKLGQSVAATDLNPGDLVFYNTLGRRNSHVGIYLGDERFVHAPSSRGVVRIEDMRLPYWTKRYSGARRVSIESMPQRKSCCS